MYYSAKNPADHITDHLPFRSTRKQWTGERRRAQFSERKGAEKAIFGGKCHHKCVWEQDAAGSSPVTPTKNQPKMRFFAPLSADFMLIIGFYPPLRKKSPDGRNAACAIVTAQASFFFSEGFFFDYRDAIFRGCKKHHKASKDKSYFSPVVIPCKSHIYPISQKANRISCLLS